MGVDNMVLYFQQDLGDAVFSGVKSGDEAGADV